MKIEIYPNNMLNSLSEDCDPGLSEQVYNLARSMNYSESKVLSVVGELLDFARKHRMELTFVSNPHSKRIVVDKIVITDAVQYEQKIKHICL